MVLVFLGIFEKKIIWIYWDPLPNTACRKHLVVFLQGEVPKATVGDLLIYSISSDTGFVALTWAQLNDPLRVVWGLKWASITKHLEQ